MPTTASAPSSATEEPTLLGLTSTEVQQRIQEGRSNVDASVRTRSIGAIFRDNICTLFNLINVILAIFVFFTGSYENALFMLVIVINVCIGIVQEIRSKQVTDKLAIVSASLVSVLRDGKQAEIAVDQLVVDDIVRLGRGDQIPADAVVLEGDCMMNESLLTGESKPVRKGPGEELMSGSFVESGVVWARIVHVGDENYAARITNEAKEHKAINSEIMTSLNKIIKYVSIFMFPVGALLFASGYFLRHTELNSTILSTVSAMVGMIPEGLILLTSTVLAVSVIRLARSNVLVQQLYCIETLARVDTLCLDKTGTITTGNMKVASIEAAKGSAVPLDRIEEAFASIAAADNDPNETALAIQRHFGLAAEEASAQGMRGVLARIGTRTATNATNASAPIVPTPLAIWTATRSIPFSSERKWSGASFDNGESYVMGATQFVLATAPAALEAVQPQLDELAEDARVLLLARIDGFADDDSIEGTPAPIGFICIQDEIRSTAAQTISYFIEQGVNLKVISGDDPHTVAGIAQKVGVPHADRFVDAATLDTDERIAEAIEEYSVFGRVRPEQKKAFVRALQTAGHTVAMTGDGVNDVLALKASDCSVAMASGSDAARNVAQLVLVDNDFASMPKVVAEGRRSINNLQRSASLFLVKTLFSITAALLFILLPWQYPFVPIQVTLLSAFTIGIPSFVLALEPNHDRVRGHFLSNSVVRSIPGAICIVVTLIAVNLVGHTLLDLSYPQTSTLCLLLTAFVGVLLVIRLSIPFTPIRWALLVVVIGGMVLGSTVFGWFFEISPLTPDMVWVLGIGALANLIAFQVIYSAFERMHGKALAKLR